MPAPLDSTNLVTLEELTISNMWEVTCAGGAVEATEEVGWAEERWNRKGPPGCPNEPLQRRMR